MKFLKLFTSKSKVSDASLPIMEKVLNEAESFTIPDIQQIEKYVGAFEVVLAKSNIDNIFKIVKFINQKSSNGLIYVVQLKGSKSKFSKLLIKIQKSEMADPASYEYYIGLTLNKLRGMDIPNFGLVYGRFYCGFNPDGKTLCDKKFKGKTNVLYEYITSLSDKTITLQNYIDSDTIEPDIEKKNVNLINIIIMLLISIQKAQDILKFTHYDLHLENVLLVELNATYNFVYEYGGKKYNIVLDYFPFIIDYGRSYVDPNIVDKVSLNIYDTDNKKSYSNFETYQNEMWKDKRFSIIKDVNTNEYNTLVEYIKWLLSNSRFVSKLKKVMEKEFKIKETDITVDMIIDNFYKDENGGISYGITPWKFNEQFDHCKLLNHVCYSMTRKYSDNKVWKELKSELDSSFPFAMPGFGGILKYYQFMKYDLKKPIDVVEYLYIDIESQSLSNSKTYDKLYYSQIGGEKAKGIYKKLYKKMIE